MLRQAALLIYVMGEKKHQKTWTSVFQALYQKTVQVSVYHLCERCSKKVKGEEKEVKKYDN